MAKVHYADLWGLRKAKYGYLLENDFSTTGWQELEPLAPYFFLVPKEFDLYREYARGWRLPDMFGSGERRADQGKRWGSGVKTNRDRLLVALDKDTLEDRVRVLLDTSVSDEDVESRFGLEDSRYWNTHREREKMRSSDSLQRIAAYLYRPFDTRWVLYQPNLIEIGRGGASKFLMPHLLRDNVALCAMRQVVGDPFRHVLASKAVNDMNVLASHHVSQGTFPLYVYSEPKGFLTSHETGVRQPNLSGQFIAIVAASLLLDFIPDGKGDLANTFGPEDVFHYMYAVFHSPTYRERYAEFLKIDFPRLPLTSDLGLFRALAEKGDELVALHLMESPRLHQPIAKFPIKGSSEVEKVRYAEDGRVYINKTQYFEGVEKEVWEFHIGGYQVLEKWLKDRKGRTLSYDDVTHYGKIVVALKETIRLMQEIDEIIPSWPIE